MDCSLDSDFQVNIFGDNRDITKSQFLHDDNNDDNDNDDAKAMAIPWVFSKTSRAKKERMLVPSTFSLQSFLSQVTHISCYEHNLYCRQHILSTWMRLKYCCPVMG